MRKLWGTCVVAVALAACYPKSAPPPAAPTGGQLDVAKTKYPDATEASLAEGQKVFVDHCNKCHDYPDLHSLSADAVANDVRRMAQSKAKLDPAQTELVVRFAVTVNGSPPVAAPLPHSDFQLKFPPAGNVGGSSASR